MKFSELKGRAVVDLDDARKIGEVEDLMVESHGHSIVSLKVRTGLFRAAKLVPVADVKNVGADAVTISAGANPAPIPADMANPTASGNADQSAQQQSTSSQSAEGSQPLIEITSILGSKVVTDTGTMVGELSDAMVDWVDLKITGYEVREGGLFAKPHEFAATPEVTYGNKMITIPTQLLNHPH
jgi:sporulation protein YlmC with PRC-barrel domain